MLLSWACVACASRIVDFDARKAGDALDVVQGEGHGKHLNDLRERSRVRVS